MTAIVLTLISVPSAQASGATDTQLPGRNLAKVAPEVSSSDAAVHTSQGLVSTETIGARSLATGGAQRVRQSEDSRGNKLSLRAPSTCRSARVAAVYFRFRTWTHQELRDGKLASKSPIVAGKSCHWAKFAAAEWKARARSARRSFYRWLNNNRVPVGEAELRAYINDDCLEEIIDRESADTWSPTVRNYTDGIAYGLPQARPGWKMASAGADWETNPKTQIAWMRGYVNGRYGGSCAALAHHNANGWY